MGRFEILCVTMHQNDFSKLDEMNIHSDVVFANQCDRTAYDECEFDGHTAKMISTQTRGVGINRNTALMYATADICLFADDDVKYVDNVEQLVLSEFDAHPDADIFIFNLDTDDTSRPQKKYFQTKKCSRYCRVPWAGFRIAIRLSSIRKANVWFTTLFGGGCVFPSGEDSMWLTEAKRKGLTLYVSKEIIGTVSFNTSTWFTGYNEKYYYARGVYYAAVHPKTYWVWMHYFSWRTRKFSAVSKSDRFAWMKHGLRGYKEMLSFEKYKEKYDL